MSFEHAAKLCSHLNSNEPAKCGGGKSQREFHWGKPEAVLIQKGNDVQIAKQANGLNHTDQHQTNQNPVFKHGNESLGNAIKALGSTVIFMQSFN